MATLKPSRASIQFWMLTFFLITTFATGGSERNDVQSLAILNPLSLMMCAFAAITLRHEHIKENAYLLAGCSAVIFLAIAHLVPLPPSLWQSHQDYRETASVGEITVQTDVWRAWTPKNINGALAIIALTTPLAVILLGIQLRKEEKFRLFLLLIGLASLSGFIGFLQAISETSSALYFYRITNNGSAVGLFANRNHAAVLLACLFPMLAVSASSNVVSDDEQRKQKLWAVVIAIVVVPLILVTGSRSGFLIAVLGLGGAMILYRGSDREITKTCWKAYNLNSGVKLMGGLIVIILASFTIFFSRAAALERFWGQQTGESRVDFVIASINIFWAHFPWGSGSGSFVDTFQVAEPIYLLDSTYLNRAHNDWVETSVTFGVPGIAILATALGGYLWRTYTLWQHGSSLRRSVMLGRMGGVTIGMIGLASLSDYPLRTPIMMTVLAVLILFFVERTRPVDHPSSFE